jgi:hypothetical protein
MADRALAFLVVVHFSPVCSIDPESVSHLAGVFRNKHCSVVMSPTFAFK